MKKGLPSSARGAQWRARIGDASGKQIGRLEQIAADLRLEAPNPALGQPASLGAPAERRGLCPRDGRSAAMAARPLRTLRLFMACFPALETRPIVGGSHGLTRFS